MGSRVYVETSVISYLAAHPSRYLITAARQQLTHDWWRLRRPQFEEYISQLVRDEAAAGDPEARRSSLSGPRRSAPSQPYTRDGGSSATSAQGGGIAPA